MLSTEYSIQINGITLFRDHADKRKYYYLPKGDIHIADNGKKLNYFAYVDSSMADSLEQQGGFLTFEVELGPSDEELEELKTHFPELLKYAKIQDLAEKRVKGEPVDESDWDKEMDAEEKNLTKDDFVLAPVPFKDGEVSLCVLGEGGTVENPLSQVKIVGSQKPSLFGKQTAVFSVRLTGKDAEIMYQMLNISKKDNKGVAPTEKDDKYINSHIAVVYDLKYNGIAPAHYVKITIDFHAVEDYWNHHVNAKVDFNYAETESPKAGKETDTSKFSIPIVLSADLDFMYRDLINEGSIVVQQIDYTGNDVGSPLEGDPSAIKLVKELMSAELFTATAAPSEVQEKSSVASDVTKAVGGASETAGKIADAFGGKKTDEKKNEGGASSSIPEFSSIAGNDKKITKKLWDDKKLPKDDFYDYAVVDKKYLSKEGYEEYLKAKNTATPAKNNDSNGANNQVSPAPAKNNAPTGGENQAPSASASSSAPRSGNDSMAAGSSSGETAKNETVNKEQWKKADSGRTDDQWKALADDKGFVDEKQYNEYRDKKGSSVRQSSDAAGDATPSSSDAGEGVPSTVTAVEWSLGVNVGYTLKRRKTDEKVKRTYVFNKQTAMEYIIHPSGRLTVEGTDFDVDKQVTVGRLGEGPFRNHEIYFGSALDFDTYHLEKILIDVNHMDSVGTVIELTKEKTSDTIHFISERFKIAADNEDEQTEEAKQNAYQAGDKLSYRVSFIFKPLTIKGYGNEDRVLIKTAEKYTSSKVIMIGPEDIDGVYALDIQTGNLKLGQNIKSATFSLIQAEEGEGELCIYNQKLEADTDKIIPLNPNKKYKARVQYNLESSFENVAVMKKDFTYTTRELTAKELVIQDPTAGMVKITPSDGSETFEEVKNITVKLRKGDESPSTIQLTKAKSECYYVTDYTEGAPEKVLVESIKVKYRDKDMDPEEYTSEDLDVDEFSTDEMDYVLDV